MYDTSKGMDPSTEHLALALRNAIRGLVRRFSISERADVSCCGMTVAQAATLDPVELHGADLARDKLAAHLEDQHREIGRAHV